MTTKKNWIVPIKTTGHGTMHIKNCTREEAERRAKAWDGGIFQQDEWEIDEVYVEDIEPLDGN